MVSNFMGSVCSYDLECSFGRIHEEGIDEVS